MKGIFLIRNILRAILLPVVICSCPATYAQVNADGSLAWQQPEGPGVLPWPANYPIPVFESPASSSPVNYIVQDAIGGYRFTGIVTDESLLRFKVFFYIPACTSGWYSEGWIDKTHLAVVPEATLKDDATGLYYRLYDSPAMENYRVVAMADSPRMLQPLEFALQRPAGDGDGAKYLVKVVVETGSGVAMGWIDGYSAVPTEF